MLSSMAHGTVRAKVWAEPRRVHKTKRGVRPLTSLAWVRPGGLLLNVLLLLLFSQLLLLIVAEIQSLMPAFLNILTIITKEMKHQTKQQLLLLIIIIVVIAMCQQVNVDFWWLIDSLPPKHQQTETLKNTDYVKL